MHVANKHPGGPNRARRTPVGELADWLLDAALLMILFSGAALVVVYFVLLIIL
jgi:hypothetical protein